MTTRLVECVPNFSEGRDRKVIDSITDAMVASGGVRLMDVDPGEATNRTVVTIVGPPDAVVDAAFAGIAQAAQVIDMSRHTGAHPRFGATDVCPFVPVEGVTMEECADDLQRLLEGRAPGAAPVVGKLLWRELLPALWTAGRRGPWGRECVACTGRTR